MREERIDALVAEAKALIEEISKAGREAVEEAEATAEGNVERHQELSEELSELRRQEERLTRDREELPMRAYRAGLDEEYQREDELQERYRLAGKELERIGERVPQIEAELAELSPRKSSHENALFLHQYGKVNRAASVPLVALKRLGREISDLAEKEAGYFERILEERRAQSWGWQASMDWTPEARERLRQTPNLPGEDRTVTIRQDPDSLARKGRDLGRGEV